MAKKDLSQGQHRPVTGSLITIDDLLSLVFEVSIELLLFSGYHRITRERSSTHPNSLYGYYIHNQVHFPLDSCSVSYQNCKLYRF